MVISIKLQYIHAGKEALAQGNKKKKKRKEERDSTGWLNLCMMPCLEIKEERKKIKISFLPQQGAEEQQQAEGKRRPGWSAACAPRVQTYQGEETFLGAGAQLSTLVAY